MALLLNEIGGEALQRLPRMGREPGLTIEVIDAEGRWRVHLPSGASFTIDRP